MPASWSHKFEVKPGHWVFVPSQESRVRGGEIARKVKSIWSIPPNYAHLQKGGHVTALKQHLGNSVFIRTDIAKFFSRIHRNRIIRNLTGPLNSYLDAHQIAFDSTLSDPNDPGKHCLPYGFVQSPLIASYCLYKSAVGQYLERLSEVGYTVTVYMDDILISSDRSVDDMSKIFAQLRAKATRANLPLNEHKTFPPSTSMSAFNIEANASELSISPLRLQAFRQKLLASNNPHEIHGVLRYIQQINMEQYESCADQWEATKTSHSNYGAEVK